MSHSRSPEKITTLVYENIPEFILNLKKLFILGSG